MARQRSHAGVLFPRVFLEVEPDPDEIRLDLLLLKQKIGDYNKPLKYSKQIIIDDVKEAFESETDPVTGKKWPELSTRALREPRFGILRRVKTNAKLYRAMINRFNYGVTKEGVYLNQSKIPFYAAYHQQDDSSGAPKIGRQALVAEMQRLIKAGVGKTLRTKEERVKEVHAVAMRNLESTANEGQIPQRRFIGPSPYAQKLMVGTFDAWAKDAIIIYKRGNTMVKRRR